MVLRFYFDILFYTIFYACLAVALILERYYFIYLRDNTNCTIQTSYMTKLNLTTCRCYYLYPVDGDAVVSPNSFPHSRNNSCGPGFPVAT